MTIEKAVTKDVPLIAALAVQVWLDNYAPYGIRTLLAEYIWNHLNPEAFQNRLTSPDREIYKVIINNHLVGFAEVNFNKPCECDSSLKTEVEKLYIQENFCGKGIGSKLMNYLSDICKEKNIPAMWLSVYENNERAINFYKKLGMKEIGEIYFELGTEKHRNFVFVK